MGRGSDTGAEKTCVLLSVASAPEDVGFSVIRLGYFLTVLVYVEAICWTLVWWPILDARRAEWRSEYAALETLQLDSSSPHQHSRASGSRILQANIPESSREGSGELRARGS